MRSKPFLIAALVSGMTVAAFPARADRDSAGAGIVIGGTIGALVGGPPGWVAGMVIGAALGEGEDTRNARIHGAPTYADAPQAPRYALPPPGFNGVPPDYRGPARRMRCSRRPCTTLRRAATTGPTTTSRSFQNGGGFSAGGPA